MFKKIVVLIISLGVVFTGSFIGLAENESRPNKAFLAYGNGGLLSVDLDNWIVENIYNEVPATSSARVFFDYRDLRYFPEANKLIYGGKINPTIEYPNKTYEEIENLYRIGIIDVENNNTIFTKDVKDYWIKTTKDNRIYFSINDELIKYNVLSDNKKVKLEDVDRSKKISFIFDNHLYPKTSKYEEDELYDRDKLLEDLINEGILSEKDGTTELLFTNSKLYQDYFLVIKNEGEIDVEDQMKLVKVLNKNESKFEVFDKSPTDFFKENGLSYKARNYSADLDEGEDWSEITRFSINTGLLK